MKAKLLLFAAFGALLLALGSCSDDSKPNYSIKQLRLDATDLNNECTARSSENPARTDASFLKLDEQGEPVLNEDGQEEIVKVKKYTNELIVREGDNVKVTFTPGQLVNKCTLTTPDGQTVELNTENPSLEWTVPAGFKDGSEFFGTYVYEDEDNIYTYTGKIVICDSPTPAMIRKSTTPTKSKNNSLRKKISLSENCSPTRTAIFFATLQTLSIRNP